MRAFAKAIVDAWREGKRKSVGHYSTDGRMVYAYSTAIAVRALNGRRYIVESARGDGAAHLIGCLRSAFPRAISIAKIDTFYSTIYDPTIHYPPRRVAHKIRVATPMRLP